MNLPPQYEDPEKAAAIALFKARVPQANEPGSFVGGAHILNFQRGWAMHVLSRRGNRAHWFRRQSDWAGAAIARSLCDIDAPLELIHGQGNYPRCQNCIRIMRGRIRAGLEV